MYLEKVTEGDKGERGFSGPPKKGDVIYEQPLIIGVFFTGSVNKPLSVCLNKVPMLKMETTCMHLLNTLSF